MDWHKLCGDISVGIRSCHGHYRVVRTPSRDCTCCWHFATRHLATSSIRAADRNRLFSLADATRRATRLGSRADTHDLECRPLDAVSLAASIYRTKLAGYYASDTGPCAPLVGAGRIGMLAIAQC